MRWQGRRESSRVEDRRGSRPRMPGGRGAGIGLGGIVILLLVSWITGTNPLELLQSVEGGGAPSASTDSASFPQMPGGSRQDEHARFVSVVLADTEDVWSSLFPRMGRQYQLPTLVLFDEAVASACGYNSAAVGPFYCPADRKVYIDLSFFAMLDQRFGAPGDFAQAYVVAHEVGHHVQNLLGISDQVHHQEQRSSREEANALSVRLELQADCFAGVWGYHNQRYLEDGDVEEGLNAAAAIGDDMMQRQAGAAVRPESWTHGSSEQRARWLRRGLESGDPESCDTFARGSS